MMFKNNSEIEEAVKLVNQICGPDWTSLSGATINITEKIIILESDCDSDTTLMFKTLNSKNIVNAKFEPIKTNIQITIFGCDLAILKKVADLYSRMLCFMNEEHIDNIINESIR